MAALGDPANLAAAVRSGDRKALAALLDEMASAPKPPRAQAIVPGLTPSGPPQAALSPVDGGTQVEFVTEFEFGIPMLSSMLNPVAKMALKSNSRAMLEAIGEQFQPQAEAGRD